MKSIFIITEKCGCGQEYSCSANLTDNHTIDAQFFTTQQEADECKLMLYAEHENAIFNVLELSLANLPVLKKRFALRKLTPEERCLLELPDPDNLKK